MIRRALRGLASALALAAFAAPAASASPSQQSVFMDDPRIVYSAPENLEATLAEIKGLGADRIRVSVFWHLLAPAPDSETRPFGEGGGADPRNYSAEKWDRYDRIVTTAARVGLDVLFNPTSPAPRWATPSPPPREDLEDTYRPNAAEFGDFVKAVGTRYSGSFADEAARQSGAAVLGPCPPTPNFPLPPATCASQTPDPSPSNPNPPNTGPVLPRVDTWSMWNEPNMPGWLTPQSAENDRRLPASPHVYRGLADEMYAGLQESGHGSDTILLGETAPRGATQRAVTQSLPPLLFIRELYCLNRRYRPFSGRAAERRGCPPGGRGFAAAHPSLFEVTAFAHHPYAFEAPPRASDATRDHVVLADIRRLTRTLDRVLKRHGRERRLPIWLTEYGYQTDPPDPYSGWSWKTHARYLSEAEWLAYRQPRVRTTAQFLLYDDSPRLEYPPNDPRHWGTFQTGLRAVDGTRKAAYRSYARTIRVPGRARRGRRIDVLALYRPATSAVPAELQFRRDGGRRWQRVIARPTNAHGFLRARVEATRSGAFRARFRTGGRTLATRAARIRVSR